MEFVTSSELQFPLGKRYFKRERERRNRLVVIPSYLREQRLRRERLSSTPT